MNSLILVNRRHAYSQDTEQDLIAHEPWHFRYVGMPHSEIMTFKGLTLEEYLA